MADKLFSHFLRVFGALYANYHDDLNEVNSRKDLKQEGKIRMHFQTKPAKQAYKEAS